MTCAKCGSPCQGRLCAVCESMESQEDGLKQAVERGLAAHDEDEGGDDA